MSAETEFDRLAAMLPFYLNGTLDDAGCRQLEVALAYSPELRARLDEERGLAAGVIADTEAGLEGGDDVAEEHLSRMMAGLTHNHPGAYASGSVHRGTARGGGQPSGAPALLDPRRWNLAHVLGAGLIALAGIAIWQATVIARLQAENFDLVSSADQQERAGAIMVQFRSEARWDAITALLDAEGMSIVSGSASGAVTVSSSASGAQLAEQLESLRASPIVAAAAPAG